MAVTDTQIIALAEDINDRKVDKLGDELGFSLSQMKRYKAKNNVASDVTSDGTKEMLSDWRDDIPQEQQRGKLHKSLKDARLGGLADKYFGDTTKKASKRKAGEPVAGPSSPLKKPTMRQKSTPSNPKTKTPMDQKKTKARAGNQGSVGTPSSRYEIPKGNLLPATLVVVGKGEKMKTVSVFRMAVLLQGDDKVRDLYIEDTRAMSNLIKAASKLKVKQQVVFTKVKKGESLNTTSNTEILTDNAKFEYDKSIFEAYVNPPVMSLQEAKEAPNKTRMSLEGTVTKAIYHEADRRKQLTLSDGHVTVSVSLWREKSKPNVAIGENVRIKAVEKNDVFFNSTPSTGIKGAGARNKHGVVTAIKRPEGENGASTSRDHDGKRKAAGSKTKSSSGKKKAKRDAVDDEEESSEDAPDNPEGDGSHSDGDENPLDSLSVPPEILARGLRAQQAFAEAARAGTKKVFRTRLMLVGQERVGKTSLMKSLTGQGFDENEAITDGVETANACKISVEDANAGGIMWSIHRKEHESLDTKDDEYSKALADEIAKKLIVTTQDPGSVEPQPDHADSRSTNGRASVNPEQTESRKDEAPKVDDRMPNQSASQVENSQKEQVRTKDPGSVKPEPDRKPTDGRASVNPEQAEARKDEVPKADDRMPNHLANLVENSLKEQVRTKESGTDGTDGGKDDGLSLSIWDFAGHDVYYTTHQWQGFEQGNVNRRRKDLVFLTWRGVYVIVFDLSRSLDSVVQPECRDREYEEAKGGGKSELTCLEFINFWLCSIFAHAVAPSSVTTKNTGKTTQKSPPIFIVGTHRDSVKGNPKEKQKQIDSAFDAIRKTIKKKPFECHVVPKYYAIENSLDDNDEQLTALRKHIKKVAIEEPYMGEEIPLRWLLFEEALAAGKNNYMSLDQTKELTRRVGMESEGDLLTMLTFYHDLGYIVYYGDMVEHQSLLRDIVILNPQWLIDVFKQVITILDPAEREGIVSDAWSILEEDGILEDHLIQHMWQDFLEQKEALMEIMAKFDLICEVPAQRPKQEQQDRNDSEVSEETEVIKKRYYVPSRLTSPFPDEEMGQIESSLDFYVDFRGFLPDGLFHRLMTRTVVWMGEQKYGQPVSLFYRHISLMADKEHRALFKMLPHNEATIKVTVFRPNVAESDEKDVSSDHRPPNPNAVREVMDFVNRTLDSLRRHWAKRVEYDVCFPCPTCGKKKLFKECLNESIELLQCGQHAIHTASIKSKYGLVQEGVDSCIGSPMLSSRSITKESRILCDSYLSDLAEQIGSEWQLLGIRLSLNQADIDHINEDKLTAVDRILAMLQLWRQRSSSGVDKRMMIEELCKALSRCNRTDLAGGIKQAAGIR